MSDKQALINMAKNNLEFLEERKRNDELWDVLDQTELELAAVTFAALTAEPKYYIVRRLRTDAYGTSLELDAYLSELDARKCRDDQGGVIEPVYTAAPAASWRTEEDERLKYIRRLEAKLAATPIPNDVQDSLHDSAYLHGVTAGWNAAQSDEPNAALKKIQDAYEGHLKPLRDWQKAGRPMAANRVPDYVVEWQYPEWAEEDDGSAYSGVLKYQKDDFALVEIDGKPTVLKNAKLRAAVPSPTSAEGQ